MRNLRAPALALSGVNKVASNRRRASLANDCERASRELRDRAIPEAERCTLELLLLLRPARPKRYSIGWSCKRLGFELDCVVPTGKAMRL